MQFLEIPAGMTTVLEPNTTRQNKPGNCWQSQTIYYESNYKSNLHGLAYATSLIASLGKKSWCYVLTALWWHSMPTFNHNFYSTVKIWCYVTQNLVTNTKGSFLAPRWSLNHYKRSLHKLFLIYTPEPHSNNWYKDQDWCLSAKIKYGTNSDSKNFHHHSGESWKSREKHPFWSVTDRR